MNLVLVLVFLGALVLLWYAINGESPKTLVTRALKGEK